MAANNQNKYDEDFKKSLVSLYHNGKTFYNAVCECFFKYLKKEETNRRTYHTFNELHLSVFEYIEGYYNSWRSHGSLGYLTPNEIESAY